MKTASPRSSAGPETRSPAPGWSIETSREERFFAALAAEWDDLHARCPAATPFQSHAWLASWWQEYGVPGRLRLFAVRKAGQLVAAAAMTLARRWPYPVLCPLGVGVSDYTDVLIDGECGEQGARVLAQALLGVRGWRALDLREVRARAAARTLYEVWPGGRWTAPDSACLQIYDACMDSLLARLPGRTASKLRSKIRKLDKHGVTVRAAGPEDADEAVATLLRLHGQQWQGRGIEPEHLRRRFQDHLRRAVPKMIAAGHVTLLQYSQDGKVVACDLLLVGHDFVGGYLYGVNPELTRAVHVNAMFVRDALAVKQERGIATFSLLRGVEDHKMHWRPELVRNDRLVLGRPASLTATAHATLVRNGRATAAAVKKRVPERFQPWLRAAVRREWPRERAR